MKAKKAKRPRAWNSTLAAPAAPTLKRSAMKRGGKIRSRNQKRREGEWARAYGSAERVEFVASRPCIVPRCTMSPCQNAHTSGDGGMGRKSSARYIVPLCAPHHNEQHEIGAGTFALKYSINLRDAAAATEAAWQRHLAYVHQQESTQ